MKVPFTKETIPFSTTSKRILLWFMSKSVLSMLSSVSFMVSSLIFKSLIYFEFIFVYGFRECSSFILLYIAVQFSQHHLLKRLFSIVYYFLLCCTLIDQRCRFISGFSILFHYLYFFFLCWHHIILMTVALQYGLKSRNLILPSPFFFLRMALAVQGIWCVSIQILK